MITKPQRFIKGVSMNMNGTATVPTQLKPKCSVLIIVTGAGTIKKIHVCGFRNFGSCDCGVNDHRVPGIVFCLAHNLVK